ncbi:MAG: hypothetical protein SFT92_03275 [Rickettsiales bacterium]|nr:hypothetical protein [Rickettsiales bacterium]
MGTIKKSTHQRTERNYSNQSRRDVPPGTEDGIQQRTISDKRDKNPDNEYSSERASLATTHLADVYEDEDAYHFSRFAQYIKR